MLILALVAVNVWLAIRLPVSAVGETLTIDAPVVLSGTNTLTAPKFIDTDNSAYFFDPAATGTSLVTAGNVTAAGTIESTTGGFKFPDATTQTSAASALPASMVSFFNLTACPTGWTELTTARGRVITGLPLSGTLAGTVGTAFTNLEDKTHTHSFTPAGTNSAPTFTGSAGTTASGGVDHTHTGPSHTHTGPSHQHLTSTTIDANISDPQYGSVSENRNYYDPAVGKNYNSGTKNWHYTSLSGTGATSESGTGATSGASAYSHTHGFTPAGTVAAPTFTGTAGTSGTAATSGVMPYIQLLACQKS